VLLLCCESVGGAQRERRTDTHTETERQRGRAETARQRDRDRERTCGFCGLESRQQHSHYCCELHPTEKELGWRFSVLSFFLSFFLSFGSFRFLVVFAAPVSFPIGVGFFFCR
jgi:hypothetical protein